MQYKIVVDKQSRANPSAEKKEYIVDIEELRQKGDVQDSLIIEGDRTYVIRRLSLSKYGVLSVLSTPKTEEVNDIDIELFEGDNYIYLVDMVGNKFYAEYVIKNEITDGFPTKVEMNTAISQTANQIISTVSATYSTKEELATAKTEIKQTTDSISTEVSKKVGSNEVISKINQTPETVTINANKVNLSGYVTVSNLQTAGKTTINGSNITTGTIDASKANITNINADNIKSGTITGRAISGGTITGTQITNGNNFSVDKNGNLNCKNAVFDGKITSNSGTIAGFTIGEDLLSTDMYGFNSSGDVLMWVGSSTPSNAFFLINRYGWTQCNTNDSNATEDKICGAAYNWAGYYTDIKPHIIKMGETSNASPDNETIITRGYITTPSLVQTSLSSAKKNFEKLGNALDIVKNTDIYKYNLKSEKDGDKKHVGFVIGDDYKYSSDITATNGKGEEIGADLYSMVSVAYKAIQEQQEIIESLTKRIEKLEEDKNG